MTYKEMESLLCTYRWELEKQIDLQNEREKWTALAEKVTPTLSGMPSGGNSGGTRIETAAEAILELNGQLDDQIKQCIAARQKVEQLIDMLDKDAYKNILRKLYINCFTWREVVARTGYNAAYAKTLKQEAIHRLCEIDMQNERP